MANPNPPKAVPNKREFESLVEVLPWSGCWIWLMGMSKTGGRRSDGYGLFKRGGKKYKAHRYSYTLYKGVIPDGGLVCHSCDVPECVNPAHLFVGSHKQNSQDCARKGRTGKAFDRIAFKEKMRAASYFSWQKRRGLPIDMALG